MEERLIRLEDKLDKISELQADIRVNLQDHMRRTEVAETNIENLAKAMSPVQEHVAFIRACGRILTVVVAIASAVAGILKLLK